MAFFTRKGLTVPEFPIDGILTEESEEFHLPPTPSSLGTEDNSHTNSTIVEANEATTVLPVLTTNQASPSSTQNNITDNFPVATTSATTTVKNDLSRFDYVVDRTYGVEV